MSTVLAIALVASAATFQITLDEARLDGEIPGISAVVSQHGEEKFAGASGLADIETGAKMNPDSRLYAGSLSKIFTAVLTLNLVDSGDLSLDETVARIPIAEHSTRESISIAHLLTHASGLDREGNFGYWFSGKFPDSDELTDYLASTTLRTSPGETARYSNIGYAALGNHIHRTTGQSYEEILAARILKPLGLSASGAPGPVDSIARGYTPPGRIIPNEDRPFAGVGKSIAGRHIREYHDAAAMTPAFGIYTSARDLGRLAQAILGYDGRNIVSDTSRTFMLTPRISGRSLGLRVTQIDGRTVARHDGWFAAHKSHFLLDIESGISVVVMTNSDNAAPAKVAQSLLERALATNPD